MVIGSDIELTIGDKIDMGDVINDLEKQTFYPSQPGIVVRKSSFEEYKEFWKEQLELWGDRPFNWHKLKYYFISVD